MEKIKDILMRRDKLTEHEALDLIEEVKEQLEELLDGGGSLLEAEDIVRYELGLEPDYLEELLF